MWFVDHSYSEGPPRVGPVLEALVEETGKHVGIVRVGPFKEEVAHAARTGGGRRLCVSEGSRHLIGCDRRPGACGSGKRI